jgi:predicted ATPase with chaperone activity
MRRSHFPVIDAGAHVQELNLDWARRIFNPMRRITVNPAPADLEKEGPSYDPPIAVGTLIASGHLEAEPENVLYLGELSLDGS